MDDAKQPNRKEWQVFERAVARVERMLRGGNSTVEWNAPIQTTAGVRRCDAVVRYESDGQPTLVLIECRRRKNKSDVMWIDELVGKTKAIGADRVIAVSNQKLTANALRRCEEEGIEVRTLGEFNRLSEHEVLKLCGASFTTLNIGLPILHHEHVEILYAPPQLRPFPYQATTERSKPIICDILTDGVKDLQDVLDVLLSQRGPILGPSEQSSMLLTHVRPNGGSLTIRSEKKPSVARNEGDLPITTLRFSICHENHAHGGFIFDEAGARLNVCSVFAQTHAALENSSFSRTGVSEYELPGTHVLPIQRLESGDGQDGILVVSEPETYRHTLSIESTGLLASLNRHRMARRYRIETDSLGG